MHLRYFSHISLAVLLAVTTSLFAQERPSRTIPGVNSNTEKPTSNNPVKGPDDADQAFLKHAAIGDAAEIQLGQMAQQKGANAQVKQFGERMVKVHSQADDQLKGIAESQHIALPTELDPQHQNAKAALSKKSGSQFDQDYLRIMVRDHQKTLQMFKHEAESSHDPTLKQFAQQSLPILESHLSQAQQIESQLKH